MTFTDWLASTFGTALVLTVLVKAFWNVILNHVTASVKHKFEKDLETHKDQLNRATELAIKDVEASASERNIKLTNVFEKQAEVVVGVYQFIVTIDTIVKLARQSLVYPYPESRTQLSDVNKTSADSFKEFFKHKKIYLPKQTAKQINLFMETASKLVTNIVLISGLTDVAKANNFTHVVDDLKKEVEQLEKEIPVLLETLEDDF